MSLRFVIAASTFLLAACASSQAHTSRPGSVQSGARCDFGGHRDYTCSAGLVCCYAGSTDGWGHCVEHCQE